MGTPNRSLFESLPGKIIPVSDVTTTLAHLWQTETEDSNHLSSFKACQMNLILYLGPTTPTSEGLECFNLALHFAQKYPCRILVLCPEDKAEGELFMHSKVFAQCYVQSSRSSHACCEAIILSYPIDNMGFLKNQLSLWLESDLPTYYWSHRIGNQYTQLSSLSLIQNCQRVVYDSCLEDTHFSTLTWLKNDIIRDLANARTLPIRQSLGQFFSGYTPQTLVENLETAVVFHAESLKGEAHNLIHWMDDCLQSCKKESSPQYPHSDLLLQHKKTSKRETGPKQESHFESNCFKIEDEGILKIEWTYRDEKFFRCIWSKVTGNAHIQAKFGNESIDYSLAIKPLSREMMLAEAFFF